MVRERSKAQRAADEFARGAARVVRVLRDVVVLPPLFGLEYPIDPSAKARDTDRRIEESAVATRDALNAAHTEPLSETLVTDLEAGGVVAVLGHGMPAWVNAYGAVVDSVPLLVIREMHGSTSAATNLAIASALGRMVMHRRTLPGASERSARTQADRFARSFLAPSAAMRQELPSCLDWDAYFEMKGRWGIPLYALLARARDLQVVDPATHAQARRHMDAQMWTLVDPHCRTLPAAGPSLLSRAADARGLSVAQLAERAHLPEAVVVGMIGATV